jgi:long-subunit fatty acid transport protein
MNSATTFFKDGGTFLTGLSTGATALAAGLQTAVAGGAFPGGAETPISLIPQYELIAGLLGAAKVPLDMIAGMNVGQAIGALNQAAPGFAAHAKAMNDNSAATQDIYADVEQSGKGFTPILSLNYSPSDKFNFSLRYEFKTKLELTTTVFDNKGAGVFVDGKKIVADMPALLALGAEVKPIDKLAIAATFNTYFDKKVDYSGGENIDMIKRNYLEYGIGVEYSITDKFRASAGWLGTNTGILPEYQNDQRFSSNSNSFGLGIGYRICPLLDLNIGGQYSINANYDKLCSYAPSPTSSFNMPYTETYGKKTMIFAIGLDFYFGK